MADYIAASRSTYFRVKHEGDFKRWAHDLELRVEERVINKTKYVALFAESGHGDWPSYEQAENGDDDVTMFVTELAKHLEDDSVAVLLQCGAEKLRYLGGWAIALNSKAETVRISIDDIYEKSKHLGKEVTAATW